MKAEVDKLEINELFNVPTGFNNLKTKEDDLDVGKFKTTPAPLKKLNGVMRKKVVKKTVCNKLIMKVPDATTLIHMNQ